MSSNSNPKKESNLQTTETLNFWKKWEDQFIEWQLPNESDLFKILNLKQKFETLPNEESNYFKYYKNTFLMENLSALGTIPIGILAYKYRIETKKIIKDIPLINKCLKLLFFTGIPILNLFLVTFYQRNFYKHPYEDKLRIKYMKELKEMNKSTSKKSK